MHIAWGNLQAGSLVRFQAAGLDFVEVLLDDTTIYNLSKRTRNTATWGNFTCCKDFHSSTFICRFMTLKLEHLRL